MSQIGRMGPWLSGVALLIDDSDINFASGFTEVDPGGRITISTTQISFTAMPRNESDYVYKDYGANAVPGNLEILFQFTLSSSISGGMAYFTGLGQSVAAISAQTNALAVGMYNDTGTIRLRLVDVDTSYLYSQVTISTGAEYFCKLTRDESVGTYGTAYLYVATSEANRTSQTWAFTTSIALRSKQDWRYFYGVSSATFGGTDTATGSVNHQSLKAYPA